MDQTQWEGWPLEEEDWVFLGVQFGISSCAPKVIEWVVHWIEPELYNRTLDHLVGSLSISTAWMISTPLDICYWHITALRTPLCDSGILSRLNAASATKAIVGNGRVTLDMRKNRKQGQEYEHVEPVLASAWSSNVQTHRLGGRGVLWWPPDFPVQISPNIPSSVPGPCSTQSTLVYTVSCPRTSLLTLTSH